MRAFDAGWGGAVWKTLGEPIVNVSSRYSSVDWNGQRMMGLNNIELITDRPLDVNLREIAEVQEALSEARRHRFARWSNRKREAWHDIVKRAEGRRRRRSGAQLRLSARHERARHGQRRRPGSRIHPDDHRMGEGSGHAHLFSSSSHPTSPISAPQPRAAKRGGADAVSAINTINSITGIDLDTLTPRPDVGGLSSHGGYCGPAVKPIALNMVQQIGADPDSRLPISGIGGVASWRDAAEFILLGCGTVQVCTAAMHYGFRIVEDMCDGLANWMREKGFATIEDFRGLSLPRVTEWKHLDLNYKIVARIHEDKCIGCDLCYTACWDGAHQCIHLRPRRPRPSSRSRRTHHPERRSTASPYPDPTRTPLAPHSARRRTRMCRLQSLLRWSARSKTASPWSASKTTSHRNLGTARTHLKTMTPHVHAIPGTRLQPR